MHEHQSHDAAPPAKVQKNKRWPRARNCLAWSPDTPCRLLWQMFRRADGAQELRRWGAETGALRQPWVLPPPPAQQLQIPSQRNEQRYRYQA